MELEAVRRVSMGNLGFEVGRQIDDVDGTERAFFRTDATSNAETFRDEGDLGLRGDFDTETPTANHRAGLLALLPAFLD